MRDDKSLEQLLNTYKITQPDEKQLAICVENAKNTIRQKKVRRVHSFWFFIETQVTYMKREMVFSFIVSLMVMLLLQFSSFFLTENYFMEITVGIAPFWVVPIILSFMKSRKYEMLEFESVSKFGIAKIIVVRAIVNQALAILMIFFIWLLSSASLEKFSLNYLFFALISFEVASVCFLWFGKASIKNGIFSVAGWSVSIMLLLCQEEILLVVYAVNSMTLFMIALILLGASLMTLYGYIKTISFEREDERWSLG